MPASLLDPQQPCLLIYDANCRFCVAAKESLDRAGISAAESGVRLIPYDSQDAMFALGDRYRPGPPSMAYLVSSGGTVSQGLDAFLPLLSRLPGGRVIRWMMRWSATRVLAERVYGLIARHRYRLFGAVKSSAR